MRRAANDDQDRVSVWLQSAAQGDWTRLDRRLSWEGIDLDQARTILGTIPASFTDYHPFWFATLQELLEYLEECPDGFRWHLEDEDRAKIAFADALVPLAAFGLRQLRGGLARRFARDLQTELARRLSAVCSLTLGEVFLHDRAADGDLEQLLADPAGEPQTARYYKFCRRMRDEGWLEVFDEYPGLARLVAITIRFWIHDSSQFLDRLAEDQAEFADRFFDGVSHTVQSIEGAGSDPHRNGRSVRIITFDNGDRLVYKPRSFAIDVAWSALLAWARRRDPDLDLQAPAVWNRGEYGWAEFIRHTPCEDLEAVSRFYRRTGMLACLLHALMGTDFHNENLIACGEYPVPVDLETLFSPITRQHGPRSVADRYLKSVMRTAFVPEWESMGSAAVDISGIGAPATSQGGGQMLSWKHPNTDHMHLCKQYSTLDASLNWPFLSNGPDSSPSTFEAADYVEHVVAGFELAYRSLLRNQAELLAEDGPLSDFKKCKVRLIMRPTQVYVRLLNRSLTPRLLRNGIDRSLELEAVTRHVLSSNETHGCREFARGELNSLEQLDVPYLEVPVDGMDVETGSAGITRGLLAEASYSAVVNYLSNLSESNLQQQTTLLRGAFAARALEVRRSGRPEFPERIACDALPAPALLDEARRIAAEMDVHLIRDEQQGAQWIGLESMRDINRYRLQPLGSSLYDGLSGISLFYGALYSITRAESAREKALAAIGVVRERLGRNEGLGGGFGIGGTVYALVTLARLLGDSSLITDAARLSRLVTEEMIAADDVLDVVRGAAGEILGHLALYKVTGDQAVLKVARLCGEHLLARQKQIGDYRCWTTVADRPLAGFSHGAAGIAYALLQLNAVEPRNEFVVAAREAIEFERSVFSPEHDNWGDFRNGESTEETSYGLSWCHGAPGIGLARLGCLELDDHPAILEDIEAALRCVDKNPVWPNDTLCCGEFGICEMLLEADRPDLALERASGVIEAAVRRRKTHQHGFILGACTPEGSLSYGLFQGLAGIGYSLLRLAYPKDLPCILLWE